MPDAEKDAGRGRPTCITYPNAVYVPCTGGWWEPSEDPAWYRMVEPCDETCHHPVHAFNPERRKHLEETAWILLNLGSVKGGQR